MVFSSLLFLFLFLPVTIALYYAARHRTYRNLVLFVVSMIFYGWGEPLYIFVMLASILEAYLCGFMVDKYRTTNIKRAKMWMVISLCLNLAALLFFKYCNFFIENLMLIPFLSDKLQTIAGLTLPIGISFYTFQIMSYTIDLYRGQTEVQKDFIAFSTYVTLFPQLIAGPIVRYRDVDDQIIGRVETMGDFSYGIRRFIVGLGKKILIGDAAAAVYEYTKASAELNNTTLGAWMTVIFFSLHIYFDFSGYSDMAIGLGRMFGFKFLENFDYPYMSQSITEFWRRWHMSLGTWFREYVYFPLGGSRAGILCQIRNLSIVWFLTGFWHGASWNFVLWGVYFGIILIFEKLFILELLKKCPMLIRRIYALLLIGFGWILFSHTDMSEGIRCFASLFAIGVDSISSPTVVYTFLHSIPLLIIACIGATPFPKKLLFKLCGTDFKAADTDGAQKTHEKVLVWCTSLGCIAILLLCTAYLVDSTFSPFLYFIF